MTARWMRGLRALVALVALVLPAWAQAAITLYGGGNVTVGTTRNLLAYVPLSPNTVTWAVNGVVGGNAMFGTITAKGQYTAPSVIPQTNTITITATSTAYASEVGKTTVTIVQVQPRLWGASPNSVPVGAFTLTLNGAYFQANAVARFDGAALATTRVSSTQLKATGMATAAQVGKAVKVDVLATGLGAISSDVVTVSVTAAVQPPPVTLSVAPTAASVAAGATQTFTATVGGSSNTGVTWSVNGVNGGNASLGTISTAGLYTAPAAVPSPATVTVRATSVANTSVAASAAVTVTAASGGGGGGGGGGGTTFGPVDLAAARLLDQAAFGPTPNDLARVKSLGAAGWLNEQLAMPETAIAVPANAGARDLVAPYLARLSSAPDQLRQRVAYALAQVIVISGNKNNYADQVGPYLQILSRNAFGNYRTLLGEIAISPQMGKYLDLANSNKPVPGSSANENFPRELLQLFSIGLVRLNADGTPMLDGQARPIPTYTQAEVQQVALAFTGWTYIGSGNNNWENFTGPMVPRDVNHDMRAKAFLGCSLPANQTTQQDMNATLDCVFKHPNVGPFVSLRLIRQLVKSNPSAAYVARVSTVFDNNGSGVRGDLKAVVRTILTDVEARDDSFSVAGGRLRDPVQQLVGLVRQLGGSISPTNIMAWEIGRTGEAVLSPPSVFGFYSPLFRVPGGTLAGPEFQIYTPTEAMLRGNLWWRVLTAPGSDLTLNLAPFIAVAGNTTALVDKVDQVLLYGRMPAGLRTIIAGQIDQMGTDVNARVSAALYFAALSGLHAVQH